MLSAQRVSPWLRMLMAVAVLFFLAIDISGCSKKDEAPVVAKKTQAPQAGGNAAHKMPTDAQHSAPGMKHFNKGLEYSLQHKYAAAIKEYRLALKTRPKLAAAYNNIGFAYYDKKELDKAIKNHNKALEITPSLANAYFGLALAYEKKGDKDKALTNWKEFTKRADPKSKWHIKAMAHIKELTKKTNTKQKTH